MSDATKEEGHDDVDSLMVRDLVTSLARYAAHPDQRRTWRTALVELMASSAVARRQLAQDCGDVVCASTVNAVSVAQVYQAALLARRITTTDEQEDHSTLVKLAVALWQGWVQALTTTASSHWIRRAQAALKKWDTKSTTIKSALIQWTRDNVSLVGVALAMALDTESSTSWTAEVLLPWSVQTWPTAPVFAPLQGIIRISTDTWVQSFTPILLPKVKSHPDKAWAVVQGWASLVQEDDDNAKKASWVTDAWWDVLAKALVHPNKETYRATAQRILVTWARNSGNATSKEDTSWVTRLVMDPPPTLAPLRAHVYDTLRLMATSSGQNKAWSTVTAVLLPALVPWWNKETKPEGKRACLQAAMAWIPAGTESDKANSDAGKPFWAAITSKSADAGLVIQETPTHIWPCLLEAQKSVLKTWQGLVETAQTKKSAQPEGILALHASILCTDDLPSWIKKLMCAGSAKAATGAVTTTDSFSTWAKKGGLPSTATTTPFFYQQSTWESAVTDYPKIAASLAQSLAIYTEKSGDMAIWKPSGSTCAAHAMVYCMLFPGAGHAAVANAVTHLEGQSTCLIPAALHVVNQYELEIDSRRKQVNATRQSRESESPASWQGTRLPTYSLLRHCLSVTRSTRAPASAEVLAQELVLLHAGTYSHSHGSLRRTLVSRIEQILYSIAKDEAVERPTWCAAMRDNLLQYLTSPNSSAGGTTLINGNSTGIHSATASFLTTVGVIASQFSPDTDDADDTNLSAAVLARQLCTEFIAPSLADALQRSLNCIRTFSVFNVNVYLSPIGSLEVDDSTGKIEHKGVAKKHMTEEEQWEAQIKDELLQKKAQGNSADGSSSLSADQKARVKEQDALRCEMSVEIEQRYTRLLSGVRAVALSDIEVGNACLPSFSRAVLHTVVTRCPLYERLPSLHRDASKLLVDLATCVYEIDDDHASLIALTLEIAHRPIETLPQLPDGPDGLAVDDLCCQPLPSPCESAATIFREMQDFHDTFSGTSFAFVYPMIKASLTGPRTTPGCESAVRILGMHTALLAGDEADRTVQSMRKDMIESILELLHHDRYQTFQNPSAVDVLVDCFNDDPEETNLHANDLAPLLGSSGALGPKPCRIGAMCALKHVARENLGLIKSNPLVENRIWLCCFVQDDDIQKPAQEAWRALKSSVIVDDERLPAPSPIYAAPLTPLLHSSEILTAEAAAEALAGAMSYHPGGVARNIENLCKQYIDAYPASQVSEDDDAVSQSSGASKATVSSPPKVSKKPISTGLPKKKTVGKKSALAIAGIGKPKTGTKKRTSSAAASALLKPKQERTLDHSELATQFKPKAANATPEKDTQEKVAIRLGVLRAILSVAKSGTGVDINEQSLKQLTGFLMAYGLAESDEKVKSVARDTLREVVANKGESEAVISFLLPQIETVLKSGQVDDNSLQALPIEKIYRDVSASDRRKEGAVVALGSVALHLKGPENESKVDSTVDMLLAALKTPSEDVQASVADALAKLMKKGNTPARFEGIVADILRDCLHGGTLAARRGAAYGLSAVVKGGGIATLKKYDVVKKLEEACDSGSPSSKEGSLFAMELLSKRLGLLFEPYVIVLLPSLLKSFSDGSDYVRRAASNTAGQIMSKLSAHGVKLVMPAVLESFDESAWRTKQASIQMLGAMSHLAPKQLASALPKVVPKLTEAFSDTHPKVKASAQDALNEISTVIRNPEIKEASPMLLKALTDPADETQRALEGLIATEFLHAIDAPSLALIVPIVHRGLRDRGATVKRMAGLIAGNICTMINDPRDFLPYLPTLLPDLQASLLDPIPDVRNTSAKALGTLARSLGDHILPDLRPWLVQKLRDKACSSAERSGAAQGLTEVLIASGTEVVDEVLRNELLPLSDYIEPSTREGVLWMITFLPPAMGQNFSPYIDVSLGPLVKGLSDDNENVRDVAMRAGRVLIRSHGKVHVDKILPSLEAGLEDEDHRIRLASLSLFGDLLSTIGGTSVLRGDGDTQDDIRKAERAQAQIALVLGPDTRRRVLSKLYMARSDSTHAVRHSAIQIWKTVVSVTARALRDILAVLVNLIVTTLATGDEERTFVAGQCLGDVVSKLGESVLPQIIPVLRTSLYNGDEQTKRGVCVGLTDVLRGSTKEQILRFLEIITKLVQDALSDDDEQVRSMASGSFQELYNLVGTRAFDEIVPSLMVSLSMEGNDLTQQRRALNGLTGILAVRSRELLPYIIPRLISRPITASHAHALGRISSVTSGTIQNHLSSIIPAILFELAESTDKDERVDAIRECSRAVCASVATPGVNTLVGEIASKCGSDKPAIRRECCLLLRVVVTERAEAQDFLEQIPIILRELIYRLNDDTADVLQASNAAFAAVSKHVEAEELVKHIEFMRNLLNSMVSDARRRKGGVGDGEFLLPGFNIPKGLDPLLPIYQRGILYGSPAIREVSATGLGEVLNLTAPKYLAGPLIVKMTGPLLRIVGDRNPSNVKIAILRTLGLILVKGGPALRAFVPQFQTTFVKALSDPSRQVRLEAIHALSLLMPLSTRVDPLIKELVAGSLGNSVAVEGPAKAAVQTATLEALVQVLDKGGSKAKLPASIPSSLEAAKELVFESEDPTIRQAAAKVLGVSCSLVGFEAAQNVLDEIISDQSEDEIRQHGQACAIRRIMAASIGSHLSGMVSEIQTVVEERYLLNGNQSIREAGLAAWGALVGRADDAPTRIKASEPLVLPLLKDSRQPLEVHRAAAVGIATALSLWDAQARVERLGVRFLDACLGLALQGVQRVQFAFNEVLWLALDVESGTTDGLDAYCSLTVFDNQRSIKSLHSKVLLRVKELTLLD